MTGITNHDGKERIVLITGASRGIGAALARRFAAEGAHLVLVARTVGGLEEVDDAVHAASGRHATLVPLDLTDFAAIDRLGGALYERFGHIDVVIGNAAMLGALSPMPQIEPETWDAVVALNLTANWRLIRSFDPLLRRAEAGRAIFLTTAVAETPIAYWSAYAVSKAALEMMVRIYAAEVVDTAIRVNLFDPGAARTRLRAQAFPGEEADEQPAADAVIDPVIALASPDCTRNGEVVRSEIVAGEVVPET